MLVIGIVGGISSGKTCVSRLFVELGAYSINADEIGHQVLESEETIRQIQGVWGDHVLDESGNVNRRKLAEIVFQNDSNELEVLEQITHPKIESRLRLLLTEIPNSYPAVVFDAPVMIKAGWDRHCDKLVFIDCPRHLRLRRALERGWSEEMFDAREAAQVSLDVKRSRASDVIDNSVALELVRQQVIQLWTRWGLPTTPDPP